VASIAELRDPRFRPTIVPGDGENRLELALGVIAEGQPDEGHPHAERLKQRFQFLNVPFADMAGVGGRTVVIHPPGQISLRRGEEDSGRPLKERLHGSQEGGGIDQMLDHVGANQDGLLENSVFKRRKLAGFQIRRYPSTERIRLAAMTVVFPVIDPDDMKLAMERHQFAGVAAADIDDRRAAQLPRDRRR